MSNYVVCSNKCLKEAYTKDEVDEKIEEKTNETIEGKFVVLTGEILINGDATGLKTISYPTGFTRNNSIIIGAMSCISKLNGTALEENWEINLGEDLIEYPNNGSLVIIQPRVVLNNNDITVSVHYRTSTTRTVKFKIVLMKS